MSILADYTVLLTDMMISLSQGRLNNLVSSSNMDMIIPCLLQDSYLNQITKTPQSTGSWNIPTLLQNKHITNSNSSFELGEVGPTNYEF